MKDSTARKAKSPIRGQRMKGTTIMSRPLNDKELSIFDTPAKASGRYDWDKWTNGKAYAAKQGEDFAGKVESFRYVLRAQAVKRGMTVDIRNLESGEIAFRFTKVEPVTEQTTKTTK
jgi:hypothetical protein